MSKKIKLILSMLGTSILLCACSSNTLEENPSIEKDEPLEVNTLEKDLTSIETSHLESDILTYNTILEFDNNTPTVFQNKYSDIDGIFTFRGNSLRNSPSFGNISNYPKSLEIGWEYKTSSSSWGGGAGWTGQPSIIKWPKDIRESMNIYDEFRHNDNFTEVIYGSLDGNIYFLDLETGKESRDKIKVGNPIKGSLSIDPRGVPLLYIGEGIPEKGTVGFNIYSLIDGSQLFELDGYDSDSTRRWPAFDSSAIVNAQSDCVIVGGENALLYKIKLNTDYDKVNNTIKISPQINKYNYTTPLNKGSRGIENSVATYANLAYFSDNGGAIQCVDLDTLKPVWAIDGYDDIDATITVDVVDSKPYIYIGNEVDNQGKRGVSKLKKIDGLSGDIVWEREFECESLLGDKPVNGGLLATNVVGKNNMDNLVIFSLARYKGFNRGGMFALNKDDGSIAWELEFDNYMWSSPVDVYDSDGNGYIIQGDSSGKLSLINGINGEVINTVMLNGNIESSPAIFDDTLVVATRNGTIYGVKIK